MQQNKHAQVFVNPNGIFLGEKLEPPSGEQRSGRGGSFLYGWSRNGELFQHGDRPSRVMGRMERLAGVTIVKFLQHFDATGMRLGCIPTTWMCGFERLE
jgi:hypothetical protein